MAEARHEATDPRAWSETMEPEEHVKTYGNFIELMKVGILATLSVLFALMIFAFGGGLFFNLSAGFLILFALFASVMGVVSASTSWIPSAVVTGVAFVIWLFAVL